ncbi:phosphotransferase [Mycoplasma mycoides subsp. mycoides]|nr:phosphotransferase [Mycoplasma mycoides]ADK69471.1 phosphotransferase enzyme family protein [Mycoplasma mycoides subsp. mycoides SC str. Gladysdale]AIZ55907.1 thiamine kinase [Mycoplasma mycoides subsp. mycoides]AME11215.1 LICA protein [Mycoplasma mycoides subsp. mycoides]AME12228.1 LICA protein [Mycoplasma mycoides subsp. mycoides]AME13278.1 LICA protein [Mycoplasma mycoides subsp. mycoides]
MKIKITKGGTNISYRIDNTFLQIKNYNNFNHQINYELLSNFDFVPKLISNNQKEIVWEYVDGIEPVIDLNNINLIAKQIKQLHNSNLIFPNNNLKQRVQYYRTKMNELNTQVEVINKYASLIDQILDSMQFDTPLHNDLFPFNMIQTDNKIYFVDWEYATMGDKHFELAYLIETSNMSSECEKVFLDLYKDYDQHKLLLNKIFVNYIVILWIRTQTSAPYNTTFFEQKIINYVTKLTI